MDEIILDLSIRASDDLLIGAIALNEEGCFENIDEVLYFFEKPHRWKLELEEYGFIIKEK